MDIFIKTIAFLSIIFAIYELWSLFNWWYKKLKDKNKRKTNGSANQKK